MEEKRKAGRTEVEIQALIVSLGDYEPREPVKAVIRDVSTRGAFCRTQARPPLGGQVRLIMELNNWEAQALARVMRHEEDGVALLFHTTEVLRAAAGISKTPGNRAKKIP